jgi:hypothetical protein
MTLGVVGAARDLRRTVVGAPLKTKENRDWEGLGSAGKTRDRA